MMYLHCPRCRLAIKSRADTLNLTNCPRCMARAAIASPLLESPLNGIELYAEDGRPARGAQLSQPSRPAGPSTLPPVDTAPPAVTMPS